MKEIKTKTPEQIRENDIIIVESTILKVIRIEQITAYSFRLTCAQLNEAGNRFNNHYVNVRLWNDDDIPVAKKLKQAKSILFEIEKPDENLPFFVYGTLRKGCGNYEHYLIDNTINEMPATVKGLLFHQNSTIPYMTKGEGIVHGELMYIGDDKFQRVLYHLDKLEGYSKNARWNHYNRERVMAKLEDGTEVEAYAYYCGDYSSDMVPIASGDYKKWIVNAYYEYRRSRRGQR